MAFEGRVAVVTGASSGLGRALAVRLGRLGARVGLVARRADRLGEVAAEIRAAGSTAEFAVADVADRDATLGAFARLGDGLGPVDLLIANAGVAGPTRLHPPNVPEQEMCVRVNLFGTMYAIEAVLPSMLRRRAGQLVGISSLAALRGLPGSGAYCASKAAVNAYLEALRLQLHDSGVSVTTVCPGFVDTPMIARRRDRVPWVMSPDRAAGLILRAVERRARVYEFPRTLARIIRWSRALPDGFVARRLDE